jgi:tRNA G10  N-methylase Trm11
LKPDENKDIDAIKEYYGYSNQRAKEVLDLLTGEQLSFIHERLSRGGLKNDRREKGRAS